MKIRVVNVQKDSSDYLTGYDIENVVEAIVSPTSYGTYLLYRVKDKEYGSDYDEVEAKLGVTSVALMED